MSDGARSFDGVPTSEIGDCGIAFAPDLRTILSHKSLDPASIDELVARADAEDLEAYDRLIVSGAKVVYSYAVSRRYQLQQRGGSMDVDDLFQDGMMALVEAVNRYDDRKDGDSIYGYATWRIRASISEAIFNRSRNIRLPEHIEKLTRKVFLAMAALEEEGELRPTPDTIAARAKTSSAEVSDVLLNGWGTSALSIDDTASGSNIEYSAIISNDAAGVAGQENSIPDSMLQGLNPRERKVIEMYCEGMRDVDIADEMGISRASVQGYLGRARKKVRINLGNASGPR